MDFNSNSTESVKKEKDNSPISFSLMDTISSEDEEDGKEEKATTSSSVNFSISSSNKKKIDVASSSLKKKKKKEAAVVSSSSSSSSVSSLSNDSSSSDDEEKSVKKTEKKDLKKIFDFLDKKVVSTATSTDFFLHEKIIDYIKKWFSEDEELKKIDGIRFCNKDNFLELKLSCDVQKIMYNKKSSSGSSTSSTLKKKESKKDASSNSRETIQKCIFNSFENSIITDSAANIILDVVKDSDINMNVSNVTNFLYSCGKYEDLNLSANMLSNIFTDDKGCFINFDEPLFLISFFLPMISPKRFANEDLNSIIIAILNEYYTHEPELATEFIQNILDIKRNEKTEKKYTFENMTWDSFLKELETNEILRRYFSYIFLLYIPKKLIKATSLTNDQFIKCMFSFRNTYKQVLNVLFSKFGNKTSQTFYWSNEQEKNCLLLFYDFVVKNKKNISKEEEKTFIITKDEVENIIQTALEEKELNFVNTTVKSLSDFAILDNKKNYNKFFKVWYNIALSKIITEYKRECFENKKSSSSSKLRIDIFANFFSRLLWKKVVTAIHTSDDIKGCTTGLDWYMFNGAYLKQVTEHEIINEITTYLSLFQNYTKSIFEDIRKKEIKLEKNVFKGEKNIFLNEDLNDKKYLLSKINDFVSKLNNRSSSDIKDLLLNIGYSKLILNNDLSKLKNKNPCLIAFENCVVQLTSTEAVIRKGKIEDFITKSTRIKLENNEKCNKLAYDYLNKVFPNKEVYDFALKDFSSFLYGKNAEKALRIWTGNGNNSKSILIKIFQKLLGDYVVGFNACELSARNKNKDGGAPNPSLVRAEHSRLAIISEPPTDFKLDGGMIKKHTGGDTYEARKLHSNGEEKLQATYKLVLCCNDPPEIEGTDQAVKNRLLVIPFESTWSTSYPISKEEQFKKKVFPIDENFEVKIPNIARGFAWILIENYKKYKEEKTLIKPDYIVRKVEDYWNAVNIFKNFYTSYIEKVDETTEDNNNNKDVIFLTPKKAFLEFQSFWNVVNNGLKIKYNMIKFVQNMKPILGEAKKFSTYEKEGLIDRKTYLRYIKEYESEEAWVGYRLKEDERRKLKRKEEGEEDDSE